MMVKCIIQNHCNAVEGSAYTCTAYLVPVKSVVTLCTHFAQPTFLAVQMSRCVSTAARSGYCPYPSPYPTVEHGHISKVVFVFCNVMRICR